MVDIGRENNDCKSFWALFSAFLGQFAWFSLFLANLLGFPRFSGPRKTETSRVESERKKNRQELIFFNFNSHCSSSCRIWKKIGLSGGSYMSFLAPQSADPRAHVAHTNAKSEKQKVPRKKSLPHRSQILLSKPGDGHVFCVVFTIWFIWKFFCYSFSRPQNGVPKTRVFIPPKTAILHAPPRMQKKKVPVTFAKSQKKCSRAADSSVIFDPLCGMHHLNWVIG